METQSNFTRANVVASPKVKIVDTDEELGLDLFCYTQCSNEEDAFVKQCRGLVFHGEDLLMKAFSYADEYNHTELSVLEKVFSKFTDWTFYKSYEGALLRLFHFSGKWILSTHRKLNAFRSKWSSKDSFGTLFKRALEFEETHNKSFQDFLGDGDSILERFQNKLDKNKQYMFLLRNVAENRIVCDPPTKNSPRVFHVGTFTPTTVESCTLEGKCSATHHTDFSMTENVGLSCPEKLSFLNIDQLLDYIEHHVNPRHTQGIFCVDKNNVQVKVLHKTYQDLFRIRGNEPSLKFRYLQVRNDERYCQALLSLYPECQESFDDYEKTIQSDIARFIHQAYVRRFIKKEYVTVPREEFAVISAIHTWHLEDRENNRISLTKVQEVLDQQPPTNLNHMIRRMKMEKAGLPAPPTREKLKSLLRKE